MPSSCSPAIRLFPLRTTSRNWILGCHRSREGAISRTIIRTVPATARRARTCWTHFAGLHRSLMRHLRWTSPSRHRDRTFPDCRGITNLPQRDNHRMYHWHEQCHCIGWHSCLNCNFIAGVLNSYSSLSFLITCLNQEFSNNESSGFSLSSME